MCHRIKTLTKVKSGKLSICEKCKIYHLEFNNIYLEFGEKQLKEFKAYLSKIDVNYWEQKYAYTSFSRKIPIPSMQSNLILMFNRHEIEELKTLMFCKRKDILLNADDIDYKYILN